MKKNIIFISFLFLVAGMYSQKQIYNGEINYEITMKFDKDKIKALNKKNNVSEQVKKMINSTVKNPGKANFKLLFNKNESIFEEEKSLTINDKGVNLVKIMIGKGLFYTDKNSKKILNQKEAFGKIFLIDVPQVRWVLTQRTKKIGNYSCYKATTEKEVENEKGKFVKKVTAWYTPELPINFGPKDYFGLPGLILELTEGNLLFKASKINVSFNKNIHIKKPTKGKKVTLKEYNEIAKEIIKNYRRQ